MRRASSRARAIRTFRRTASTPPPSAARRHSTSGTGSRPAAIMPVPFGTGQPMLANQGWLSKALADMEVRLVFTFQTGRPFTVALLPDIDNSNTGRSNLGFGNNDRPNVTGDPSLRCRHRRRVVRHLRVLDARVRDVRQQRTECLPGARVFEPQRRAGEADPLRADDRPSSSGSKRSTCSTGSTTICPTRSSGRRPSAGSSRRRVHSGFSWGSGRCSETAQSSRVLRSRTSLAVQIVLCSRRPRLGFSDSRSVDFRT